MRSELECRRPDFKDGVSVKFGDGGEWSVPRPSVRFAPGPPFEADGQCGVQVLYVYAADRSIWDVVKAAGTAETGTERLTHLFTLAAALLKINYALTHDELCALLGFDADEPSGGLALLNCYAVATGRDPNTADEPETETEGQPETAEPVEAASTEPTP